MALQRGEATSLDLNSLPLTGKRQRCASIVQEQEAILQRPRPPKLCWQIKHPIIGGQYGHASPVLSRCYREQGHAWHASGSSMAEAEGSNDSRNLHVQHLNKEYCAWMIFTHQRLINYSVPASDDQSQIQPEHPP
ncbi:hypothetical protein C8035_v000779 [Colletotrichum spinosum]|uniref:Uncharacterized protein n=1 Tax=Colletotrichum spinosum TaxID=1347390 RepID=A0A4R8Q2K2_9PEZI|nr:hypothetical protein C8035_v000779 [Colletotrichum spinosum]